MQIRKCLNDILMPISYSEVVDDCVSRMFCLVFFKFDERDIHI